MVCIAVFNGIRQGFYGAHCGCGLSGTMPLPDWFAVHSLQSSFPTKTFSCPEWFADSGPRRIKRYWTVTVGTHDDRMR